MMVYCNAGPRRSEMKERDEVLEFWFGAPLQDHAGVGDSMRRWFMGGEAMDQAIRARFGTLVEGALRGELDDWARDIRGRLALILLLDQFARGLYRETPQAYAGDARAQRLSHEALDGSLDSALRPEERLFLIMPLLHAEELAAQDRLAVEMERLLASSPPELRPLFHAGVEQSKKYRGIIARFGRFPHRNAVLGRSSTPEEIELLRDWKEKAPPAVAEELAKKT
jgi:uncharacterized protein (DUF924 family)